MPYYIPVAYDKEKTDEAFRDLFIGFLRGEKLDEIQAKLKLICTPNNKSLDAKQLCLQVSVVKKGQFDDKTQIILEHLNANANVNHYDHHSRMSLYHLLSHLRNNGHERIDLFLKIISKTKSDATLSDYLYALSTPLIAATFISAFFYVEPEIFAATCDWVLEQIPILTDWLYFHIVHLNNLGIPQILIQIGWGIYHIFDTFEYGLSQSDKRFSNLFFNLFSVSLILIAHIISFLAKGTLSVITTFLIILSAWVDVLRGPYQITAPEVMYEESPHKTANDICRQQIEEHDRRIKYLNLCYAICVTLVMLSFYSITPGIVYAIIYTSLLLITKLIKQIITYYIQKEYTIQLPEKLRAHYETIEYLERAESDKQLFLEASNQLLSKRDIPEQERQKYIGFRDALFAGHSFNMPEAVKKFNEYTQSDVHESTASNDESSDDETSVSLRS